MKIFLHFMVSVYFLFIAKASFKCFCLFSLLSLNCGFVYFVLTSALLYIGLFIIFDISLASNSA